MLNLTTRLPVRIDLTNAFAPVPIEQPLPETQAAPAEELVDGFTRAEIIERIQTMNPSAPVDFLDRFDTSSLSAYLEHLNAAAQPRGRMARWVRPAGSCGISWSVRKN